MQINWTLQKAVLTVTVGNVPLDDAGNTQFRHVDTLQAPLKAIRVHRHHQKYFGALFAAEISKHNSLILIIINNITKV